MSATSDEQAEALLRRYLLREERKDRTITFEKRGDIKVIIDSVIGETNEMVYQTLTDLSLQQFSQLIDRTASSPNKVYYVDYLEIQQAMRDMDKSVCYYIVYSTFDKRYRDVIIVN
jgi:hypothetical protein